MAECQRYKAECDEQAGHDPDSGSEHDCGENARQQPDGDEAGEFCSKDVLHAAGAAADTISATPSADPNVAMLQFDAAHAAAALSKTNSLRPLADTVSLERIRARCCRQRTKCSSVY
jgi:hypothetical protein